MEELFGNRLMSLRKSKSLSQEELGNLAGVSRQTVSKWELNQTTPEMDKLIALSNIFLISLDELAGREVIRQENVNYNELTARIDDLANRRRPYRYEYKSKKMIGNLPLVHINIGNGLYRSKGIVSIGMIATGVISLGILSVGVISFGILALGILAIGAMGVGLVAAGAIALGLLALGSIAIGYLSVGAMSIGVYSIGAYAVAINIALGDVASGHIAIGDSSAKGTIEFLTSKHVSGDEVKSTIYREYPRIWRWLVDLFVSQIR